MAARGQRGTAGAQFHRKKRRKLPIGTTSGHAERGEMKTESVEGSTWEWEQGGVPETYDPARDYALRKGTAGSAMEKI